MKTLILSLCVISLAFVGCASEPEQPTGPSGGLSPGMAKKTIEKGKTTQNDILTVFGAPNIVTKNKSGLEVWTYDKMTVESSSSAGYATAIIVGVAGRKSSTSTRTFTLMIEFDENNVVKDFSYRSSSF